MDPRSGIDLRARTRRWLRFVFCCLGITVAYNALAVSIQPLHAQEEEASEEPASEPEAPAKNEKKEKKERSVLDTVLDGGVVGLFIILLSVVSLGFVIEHFMTIRKTTLMPDYATDELEEMVAQGQVDQAVEFCIDPENDCMFTTIVLAGLERYKASEFGFAEYKAAVEEAGEDQTGQLYRKTEVLGLIGSIAPMLGLTGTVLGMIKAFNTIAAAEGAANPAELAGGIGQALVTTLMGLVVAIPTMVAFSYFRNKIDSVIAEAGKRVEQVLMPLGRRK